MVFHGFWFVSMVFQGIFMVFGWFFMVYKVVSCFWLVSTVFQGSFMVFHGSRFFLWLFKVPD